MEVNAKMGEHYTIGDALAILFSNPLFYIVLVVAILFWTS